jgi:REP element-mobilizing transposase RayT
VNKKTKQLSFFCERQFPKTFTGNTCGKRKTQRPLSTKSPIHLILRTNPVLGRQQVAKAFSYHGKRNQRLLKHISKKFHVQIHQFIFNFTHLHLIISIPSRKSYVGFIRVLTSQLSALVGSKRGELFPLRLFTRVATWGRGYKTLLQYIKKNTLQALGGVDISYKEVYEGLDGLLAPD